jgi:hypothetical protein
MKDCIEADSRKADTKSAATEARRIGENEGEYGSEKEEPEEEEEEEGPEEEEEEDEEEEVEAEEDDDEEKETSAPDLDNSRWKAVADERSMGKDCCNLLDPLSAETRVLAHARSLCEQDGGEVAEDPSTPPPAAAETTQVRSRRSEEAEEFRERNGS